MKKWPIALVGILIVVGLFLLDGGSIYIKQLLNRPPKAAFMYRTPTRTLKYIAPTDRDMILFLNNSTDPDGDPLTYSWFVDGRLVNNTKDHWTKLIQGNHTVRLVVSDGMKEDSATVVLPVDPAQLSNYSKRQLSVPLKGIAYHIGRYFMGDYGKPPADDEIPETLTVIRDELGCNAILLWGGYEDVMVRCAKAAINMGFKEIFLIPRYQRVAPNQAMTITEHTKRVVEFAKSVEGLRQLSEARCTLQRRSLQLTLTRDDS